MSAIDGLLENQAIVPACSDDCDGQFASNVICNMCEWEGIELHYASIIEPGKGPVGEPFEICGPCLQLLA